MLPLIAVVGNVEPALLRAFVRHYLSLGVSDVLLGFHFTDRVPADAAAQLLEVSREEAGEPRHVSRGPWGEQSNGEIRDRLRAEAGPGWHVIADSDEFHHYPVSLTETIAEAEAAGRATVEGLLYDRVSRTGELLAPDAGRSLDDTYPLGGFVTHDLVSGDSRKVLIARSELVLSSGNHWVPGLRSGAPEAPPLPVHHFKWRAGCQQYLAARMADFAASTRPAEVSMREECGRVLAHLRTHGGRLAVDGLAPATTAVLPPGWDEQAARVSDYWWRSRWLAKGGTR